MPASSTALQHETRTNAKRSRMSTIFLHVRLASLAACFITTAFLCASCGARPPLQPSNATNIVAVIQGAQKSNVRASYGEYAYQSFTDLDYQVFVEDGLAKKIAAHFVRDRRFMEAVLALRQMPELERQRFLQSCRKPLHQTWAQLGRITNAGQTEAGQRAECDIANAVVHCADRVAALSPQEIEAAFRGR